MKIFLIGFMGTGKSFWGKKWAKHFGCAFIDLDDAIVEKEGRTITTIFETQGEKYFRDVESLVLRETSDENNAIIACGGGTPCFNNNMEWMNNNGVTVYLSRQPIELYKNVAKQTLKRPLLKNKSEQEMLFFIEQKLKERAPFYEQANITLDTETIDIHSIDKIVNIIALSSIMHRPFLITASLLAALSIALGAFGAHALKKSIGVTELNIFETGVRYQMYHAMALLVVAILYKDFKQQLLIWAGRAFIAGTLLFSGSLYSLSLSPDHKWIGVITPFGGLLFIAGWLLMMLAFCKRIKV